MEKKKYLVEITYSESGDSEAVTLKTDDLAWSMNQYQRNRLPLTWELLDVIEPDIVLPIEEDDLVIAPAVLLHEIPKQKETKDIRMTIVTNVSIVK